MIPRGTVTRLRWRRWFDANKQITCCECEGPIGKRQAGRSVENRRLMRGVSRLTQEQLEHLVLQDRRCRP